MKKHYVVGFLFSEDYSRVVLIRKNRPEWQAGLLNGLGGKINLLDETPKLAMRREFLEEAGVIVDNWKEFLKLEGPTSVVFFFMATGDTTKVTTMETEVVESYDVATVKERMGACVPNLSWILPLALTNDKFTGTINLG